MPAVPTKLLHAAQDFTIAVVCISRSARVMWDYLHSASDLHGKASVCVGAYVVCGKGRAIYAYTAAQACSSSEAAAVFCSPAHAERRVSLRLDRTRSCLMHSRGGRRKLKLKLTLILQLYM